MTLHADGTKVRETESDAFLPEFPENIDVKITDRCDAAAACGGYCHEMSGPSGGHGDIEAAFLGTLMPGTELALGGGNPLEHPRLPMLLQGLRSRGVIANLTVSQRHFLASHPELLALSSSGLVHGLGVSLADASEAGFLDILDRFPHAVLHTIHGISDFPALVASCESAGVKPRVLVLGYKDVGRGVSFRSPEVAVRMAESYGYIHRLRQACEVLSFDNLAIRQLDARRFCTSEEWAESYMGDDATFTMYADLVRGEYAPSSTSPRGERRPLGADIRPMFADVRSRSTRS